MTWVITVTLVGILAPNLVKLISVSMKLLGILPAYLRWVGGDPAVLEDEDTQTRLQTAFTKIFFSIQTHALNVGVCVLLGWIVWQGRLPTPSPWLKGLVSVVSILACGSNVIAARNLIQEFLQVKKAGRAIAQLGKRLGVVEDQRAISFPTTDAVWIWAAICLYVVSAFVSVGLVYVLWSYSI